MGCGCDKGSQTVLKYRVTAGGENKDFATRAEAEKYRQDNGIAGLVRPVRVPAE